MLKPASLVALLCCSFSSVLAAAQINCITSNKLYCLIPTAFHTPAGEFNFFNTSFGTAIAQLPLATPASGFVFTFDKTLAVYTASNESFGPVMSERAETIGRHRLFVAFTYQRFGFDEIDGNDLKKVPIVFFLQTTNDVIYTATTNRFDAKVNQYAAFATFGLSDRVDVSIAIPFERISMGVSSSGTEFTTTLVPPATATFSEFIPGSASGLGDIVLAAKATVLKGERFRLAGGIELRLPSGDELNFLGTGAVGIRPYAVISRRGKVAPHANLGYQWNGTSVLARDATGTNRALPSVLSYALGADIGVTKRLTLVGDFVGQRFFNAPLVTRPVPITIPGQTGTFDTINPINGSYSADNLAFGFKANPWARLLITGNVLVKIDDGGLRARVVPLIGLSYSF